VSIGLAIAIRARTVAQPVSIGLAIAVTIFARAILELVLGLILLVALTLGLIAAAGLQTAIGHHGGSANQAQQHN
ncbi:MAG TPA: hypothetical protein VLE70_21965, partial [Anaerolineae bacterium]|nr:hypothetical protein [Anaerolineae bacterium]